MPEVTKISVYWQSSADRKEENFSLICKVQMCSVNLIAIQAYVYMCTSMLKAYKDMKNLNHTGN